MKQFLTTAIALALLAFTSTLAMADDPFSGGTLEETFQVLGLNLNEGVPCLEGTLDIPGFDPACGKLVGASIQINAWYTGANFSYENTSAQTCNESASLDFEVQLLQQGMSCDCGAPFPDSSCQTSGTCLFYSYGQQCSPNPNSSPALAPFDGMLDCQGPSGFTQFGDPGFNCTTGAIACGGAALPCPVMGLTGFGATTSFLPATELGQFSTGGTVSLPYCLRAMPTFSPGICSIDVCSFNMDLNLDVTVEYTFVPYFESYCFGNVSCPCGNTNGGLERGCAHSDNAGGALLVPAGIPSISASTLQFTVEGGTAETLHLLASSPGFPPAGMGGSFAFDGRRCIGDGMIRLGGRVSDATGNSGVWAQPGLIPAGALVGETRYYQAFLRENPELMCFTGVNWTQGVGVCFLP